MDASDSTTQAKPEAPGLLDDWLTRKQLAEQLEVSVDTLSRWETMRKGPPCVLAGRRVLCLGVSTRTVSAITGATAYDCGISGEASKFGGSLGVAQGSTNKGVIGPQAFYGDTPIRLTAVGGDFTGGAVRIAIHYLTVGLPS